MIDGEVIDWEYSQIGIQTLGIFTNWEYSLIEILKYGIFKNSVT